MNRSAHENTMKASLGVAEVLARRAGAMERQLAGLAFAEGDLSFDRLGVAFDDLVGADPDKRLHGAYRQDRADVCGMTSARLRTLAGDYLALAYDQRVRIVTGKRPKPGSTQPRCTLWAHSGEPFGEAVETVATCLGENPEQIYIVSPHLIDGMVRIDVMGAYSEEMFHLLDGEFEVWSANEGQEAARAPWPCSCKTGCETCNKTGIVPVLSHTGP